MQDLFLGIKKIRMLIKENYTSVHKKTVAIDRNVVVPIINYPLLEVDREYTGFVLHSLLFIYNLCYSARLSIRNQAFKVIDWRKDVKWVTLQQTSNIKD